MICEMKRMLAGRGLWAAVALAVAAILSGTSWPVGVGSLEPGHFLRLVQDALCGKNVYFMMPVAAVLPWSDSMLQERKGGFLKSVLPRGTRLGYAENKALAVALGSFLAWIVAGVAVLFLYFVLFFPGELSQWELARRELSEWELSQWEGSGPFPLSMAWEMAAVLLRCGLLAGILGTLGGICAVLSGSSYLGFGIPFVGYYFCIILRERYFPDAVWLYPPAWISGDAGYFLLLFLVTIMELHGYILYGKLEEF